MGYKFFVILLKVYRLNYCTLIQTYPSEGVTESFCNLLKYKKVTKNLD